MLRSMHPRTCLRCEQRIPLAAMRCPYCGNPALPDPVSAGRCWSCAERMPAAASRCPHCGVSGEMLRQQREDTPAGLPSAPLAAADTACSERFVAACRRESSNAATRFPPRDFRCPTS